MSEKRVQKYVRRDYDARYNIKLNTHTDEDVIEKLEWVKAGNSIIDGKPESVQGYIKRLVKADILANGI